MGAKPTHDYNQTRFKSPPKQQQKQHRRSALPPLAGQVVKGLFAFEGGVRSARVRG